MSDKLAKWAEAQHAKKQSDEDQKRSDLPKEDGLKPQEQKALKTMQREAKAAGSELTSGGKGGLPPSTVLGAMRRDEYKCKVCGELGDMEKNGGLGVHHKRFHLRDPKQRAKAAIIQAAGKRNEENQIVAICARCHDAVHEDDREENPDVPDPK